MLSPNIIRAVRTHSLIFALITIELFIKQLLKNLII